MYSDFSSSTPAASSPYHSLLRIHSHPKRASKAAELAQLLDPSYSPIRDTHTHIYTDDAGEAHDPDYRLFAVAPSHLSRAQPATDDDVDENVSFYSRRRSFDSSCSSSPAYDAGFFYTYEPLPLFDDKLFESRHESSKLRRHRVSSENMRPTIILDTPVPTPDAPTPRLVLRRNWEALCLRTQVAVHRARRRVRNVVMQRVG